MNIVAFKILGIEAKRAFNKIFIDSHLDIALRGLNTLKVLKTIMNPISELIGNSPITPVTTIKKSRAFQ